MAAIVSQQSNPTLHPTIKNVILKVHADLSYLV